MFGSLGIWELVLILLVVTILFGARKIPALGSGLGQGIKNFRKAFSSDSDEKEIKAK